MTTVLADAKLGVMVSDSNFTDDDRVWLGRKVFRVKGNLVGVAGSVKEWSRVLDWMRKGGKEPAFGNCSLLVLSDKGLHLYTSPKPEKIESGIDAIGTGAKATMCAYEALGFVNPRRAVSIVCKHDAGSRSPVRVYRLRG